MYNVLALHSCSELREEKDEENSGTPESARERRLTYSVSPVPPSELPYLHDNLSPPSPPTDDVVAVPTSGSRKRRLTRSISPSSSLLLSGPPPELSPLHDNTSPPADDVVAVTASGSRKRRLTHSISPSSSLLQSGTVSITMTTSSTPEREMDTEEKSVITNKFCVTILALNIVFSIHYLNRNVCVHVSAFT